MGVASKNILIVYESRTGFTKTYAHWLAEEIQADVVPLKSIKYICMEDYDIIVCGSGIYGSAINGLSKFVRLQKQNRDKQFVYFATGLRPATKNTCDLVRRYNFPDGEDVAFFYMQSGLNYEKLDPNKKMMLVCFRAMLRRRQQISGEDREILKLLQTSNDYSNPVDLEPLVRYIMSFRS